MTQKSRKDDKRVRPDDRKTKPREPTNHDHRLRGNEFADDFADADRDSSVVAPHRDEKESDS